MIDEHEEREAQRHPWRHDDDELLVGASDDQPDEPQNSKHDEQDGDHDDRVALDHGHHLS